MKPNDHHRRAEAPLFEALEAKLMLDAMSPEMQTIDFFDGSPALFVENQGQWADAEVRYAFQRSGGGIAFTDEGPVFTVWSDVETDETAETGMPPDRYTSDVEHVVTTFRTLFEGANTTTPVGLEASETVFNFITGDASHQRSNVTAYSTVAYIGLYEGIDLWLSGGQSNLKYEFHVSPGADWQQIAVTYEGIDSLALDETGSLIIETSAGIVTDSSPVVYQEVNGERLLVSASYRLTGENSFGFEVGAYDPELPLIIDPEMAWSSYIGGGAGVTGGEDNMYGVTVDLNGDIIVVGETESIGCASGGFEVSYNGDGDAYVVKISPDGQHIWSTYMGGAWSDVAIDVVTDSQGNIIVVGRTYSDGWVSGGYDVSYGGSKEGFIVKLTPDGQHIWSTYAGGAGEDTAYGVAVDAEDRIIVSGDTNTAGWMSGGYDNSINGDYDAFAMKLDSDGRLIWSTYMGGTLADHGNDVALDDAGNVYVTGYTNSAGWVSGGYDTTPGSSYGWDGFVAKLTSSGQRVWSTYVGGTGYDFGYDIAVDSTGSILVAGSSSAGGWVSGGWDTTHNGKYDGFVAKLTTTGQHVWSTFLGGSEDDYAYGVAVDAQDNVLVAGLSTSTGWVSGGYSMVFGGYKDAFVAKLDSAGRHVWSTFAGLFNKSSCEHGEDIAVDASGNVYLAGETQSSGWVGGGYDGYYDQLHDGFLLKLSPEGSSVWSTYIGGKSNNWDEGYAVSVDSEGNVIVAGWTTSWGWVAGGYDVAANSFEDAFVAKLSPTGQHLWSTYIGAHTSGEQYSTEEPSWWDHSGQSLAVDAYDNIIMGGSTTSSGWVSRGYDMSSENWEGLVVKLSPEGQHLWSTYIGGAADDRVWDVGVDSCGNVLVTGWTNSGGWVSGGYDTVLNGSRDGFLVKLSDSGEHIWSTYVGGNGDEGCLDLDIGPADDVFVAGQTDNQTWTSRVYSPTGTTYGGVFVARFDTAGDPKWTSLFSSVWAMKGIGIVVDEMDNSYLAGYSNASEWPSGGYDESWGGYGDGIVIKIDDEGGHVWSTYLGGSGRDCARAIALDTTGILIVGDTKAPGWVANGMDTTYSGYSDGFVVKLTRTGQHLWSSYLGGYNNDYACDVAVDASGAYIVGSTESSGWLPGGGYNTTLAGRDAYVVKLTGIGPKAGDANEDGKVDGEDLALWQSNYDPIGNSANTFAMGDWNGDGRIDSGDLSLWQQNYDPIGTVEAESTLPGDLKAQAVGASQGPVEQTAGNVDYNSTTEMAVKSSFPITLQWTDKPALAASLAVSDMATVLGETQYDTMWKRALGGSGHRRTELAPPEDDRLVDILELAVLNADPDLR